MVARSPILPYRDCDIKSPMRTGGKGIAAERTQKCLCAKDMHAERVMLASSHRQGRVQSGELHKLSIIVSECDSAAW